MTAKLSRRPTTITPRNLTSVVETRLPVYRWGDRGMGTAMVAEHGCRSKQVYLSKAEAKRVARLMSRRHRDALHLYQCPDCGYHHVGHIVPAWQRTPSIASRTEASA